MNRSAPYAPRALRLLALLVASGGVAAQTPDGSTGAVSGEPGSPAAGGSDQVVESVAPGKVVSDEIPLSEQEMRRIARDSLARLSLARLREIEDPTAEDYRISALGLRIARRLDPQNAELCRLEIEAWDAASEDRQAIAAVAELVKLDPSDTVAQLRLITSRIRSLQTAEDRLSAYERLLGERGQTLDASVRSRLALDAALLARESAMEDRFVEFLTQATTLDVTNKEAAAMHAAYFLERTSDGRERIDLISNLLLADPADRSTYLQLIDELFQRGAFRAALRFHERAAELREATRKSPELPEVLQRKILVLLTRGPSECLREIQKIEDGLLSDVLHRHSALRNAGQDPGEDPTSFPIPAPLEMLRMAVAFGLGDNAALAEHAARVVKRHEIEMGEMSKPPEVGVKPTPPERLREYERRVRLSRLTARLWAGIQLDEAQADIDALTQDTEEVLNEQASARIRGWMLLRRGDFEGARELFEPLVPEDSIALLGLGFLSEQAGDQRAALKHYATLALAAPQTAAGAAARLRVETIVGQPIVVSDEARALDAWSDGFAPWLDEVTRGGNSFMSLTAAHLQPRIGPLDHPVLRVTLRNTSRHPMALGPNHSINSRILCTPRMSANNQDMTRVTQPEVLNLGRRLRLMPGEEITQDLWITRGRMGLWLDVFCTSTVTLRWRLTQGFEITLKNTFEPGVLTITAASDLLTRDPLADAENFESVIEPLSTAQGRAFYHTVLRTLSNATFRGQGEGDMAIRRQRFAVVLARRLSESPEMTRVFVLPLLVRAGILTVDMGPVDACRDDPSPFVKAAMLMIGFPDKRDPYPFKLAEDADPDVRLMAQQSVAMINRAIAEESGLVLPKLQTGPSPAPSPADPTPAPTPLREGAP